MSVKYSCKLIFCSFFPLIFTIDCLNERVTFKFIDLFTTKTRKLLIERRTF